jgi:hypothetical protein
VKSFYNSINHNLLLERLENFTTKNEHKLIAKHLDRIEWQDGEYVEIKQGISKSSPLSPVLGCIYLNELDLAMEKLDIKYLRYADDWIILAKTKHKLRKAVKKCKQILAKLKLIEHPDKTDYRNYNLQSILKNNINSGHFSASTLESKFTNFLELINRSQCRSTGKTVINIFSNKEEFTSTKPFNFLGVEFNHDGAKDIKKETKDNFVIKVSRLYEYIQAISKRKNTINTAYTKGKKMYDYINRLELEMIKKFLRSMIGFCSYSKTTLMYCS